MGHTDLEVGGYLKPTLDKLTDKQVRFVYEYNVDYDGARAAKESGYRNPAKAAGKLLDANQNPLVAKAIGLLRKETNNQLEFSAEDVRREVAYSAFRDVLDLCDSRGVIETNDMRKIPEHVRRCVDGIKAKVLYDRDGNVASQTFELKLVAKLGALDLLAKMMGLMDPQAASGELANVWDKMYASDSDVPDPVAQKLMEVKGNSVDG